MKIYSILIWAFFNVLLSGQSGENRVTGRITYLTHDQVFVDVGIKQGIQVGDTARVFRRQEEIGIIIVTNTARKSSVCQSLVPIDQFQLGDQVQVVISKKEIPVVSLETEKESPKVIEPHEKVRIKYSHHGYVNIRESYSQFSGGDSKTKMVGTIQYNLKYGNKTPVNFWLYGRSVVPGQQFTIYQARAILGNRNGKIYAMLGRVFSSELAGVGATDGLFISAKIKSGFKLGALGGLNPNPGSLKFDTQTKKMGMFIHRKFQKGDMFWESSIAGIGQYGVEGVDREFSYLKFRWNWKTFMHFSFNQTTDFYRGDRIGARGKIEPISTQISLRLRPLSAIWINSRYTARKQILSQNISIPDSLFKDELRGGFYNSIQLRTNRFGSLQVGLNVRGREGEMTESKMIFTQYNSPSIREAYHLNWQTSYLENQILRGIRNILGISLNRKNGSFNFEYDSYSYGFGKQVGKFWQHTFSGTAYHRFTKNIQGSASITYSIDDNLKLLFLYSGLSYRFNSRKKS